MKVYVVLSEFQGIVDDVWVFKNEFKAIEKKRELISEYQAEIDNEKMSVKLFECDLQ